MNGCYEAIPREQAVSALSIGVIQTLEDLSFLCKVVEGKARGTRSSEVAASHSCSAMLLCLSSASTPGT